MNIKEELKEQRFLKVGYGQPPQRIMGYNDQEKCCSVELLSGKIVNVLVKKYEGVRWNAWHLKSYLADKEKYEKAKDRMGEDIIL